MHDLAVVAPSFVSVAHRIVWATVATVDSSGRPRARILHPIWEWDGDRLVGWTATSPTPTKVAHLRRSANVSCTYWDPSHDTATADCEATWCLDDPTRTAVWDRFLHGPAPVGYDPSIVPAWAGGPTSPAFAVLRLEPFSLRVMPGALMLEGRGEVLRWRR